MKPLHVVGKYFNIVFCYFICKIKIVILIFNCKKMLFCNKRSFVWLKKIVFLWEIFCYCGFSFFLVRGCFSSCGAGRLERGNWFQFFWMGLKNFYSMKEVFLYQQLFEFIRYLTHCPWCLTADVVHLGFLSWVWRCNWIEYCSVQWVFLTTRRYQG